MVNGMIEEVCGRMAIENAAAFVCNDDLDATIEQVVARSVSERLDRMDELALRVMQSMSDVCAQKGDDRMADMIRLMRSETLRQVRGMMPTEVQVLDGLIKLKGRGERDEMLQELGLQELTAIASAAAQMVTDMEEAEVIPDVAFLAKLVLVREEIYTLMEERAPGSTRQERFSELGVPTLVAGFVKNLSELNNSMRVRMQLYSAIVAGCDAPSRKLGAKPDAALERIRPGLLMTTLYILRTELDRNPLPDSHRQMALQTKWHDLVLDAMLVLGELSSGQRFRKTVEDQ